MKIKKIFCDSCRDRIFILGFKVGGRILCNKCIRAEYGFNVDDYEEDEDEYGSDSEG